MVRNAKSRITSHELICKFYTWQQQQQMKGQLCLSKTDKQIQWHTPLMFRICCNFRIFTA